MICISGQSAIQFKMHSQLAQPVLEEYLGIIKNFMLETHQRIEEQSYPAVDSHFVSIIDQVAVKIKTQKEQIGLLEEQLKECDLARVECREVKAEQKHLQRRLNQKGDEIGILRETVKTLYQDNERISGQKENMGRQISSLKEQVSTLRKKLKRQEEEILGHRRQLQQLTASTQQKISEFLNKDQQHQVTTKRLASDVERLKGEVNRKEKALNTASKKVEQLATAQQERDRALKTAEALERENRMLVQEGDSHRQSLLDEKARLLKEIQGFSRQLSETKQQLEDSRSECNELRVRAAAAQQRNSGYEGEIVLRTEKLKEKSKQIKLYGQEINKLSRRVEELSEISEQIMSENQTLTTRCEGLEKELQQVRAFQSYIYKLKGDINNKKSMELGRLMEGLEKLQHHS